MEGTRPILVEIQALVVPTKLAIPRRVVHGLDSKRVELMIAVLTRHCGLNLWERDIFVNVVGGIKVKDPGVDLAVAMAIAASYKGKAVAGNTLVIGEVGLLGEIRKTSFEPKRLARAKRQGFSKSVSAVKFKQVSQAVKALR
jgi:DNA repair protein RadA/Sms